MFLFVLSVAFWIQVSAVPYYKNAGLRGLLQNPLNQDLIGHLGTRYEIVNPVQVGQTWGQRLSTRVQSNEITHMTRTSFLIETFQYKFHLDLELNTNLFPTTLVQLFINKGDLPTIINELPENCFYIGTVKGHSKGMAAFRTCNGLKGMVFLENKIFLIYPLYGNHTENHPHLLYHISPDEYLNCANKEVFGKTASDLYSIIQEDNILRRQKIVELAIVLDHTLLTKFKQSITETVNSILEIINSANMIFRSLNTSLSLLHLEIWNENQWKISKNVTEALDNFRQYTLRRINRIPVDATYLFWGSKFTNNKSGFAIPDSICTDRAIGIINIDEMYRLHKASSIFTHMIGHNLGMSHDSNECSCSNSTECMMLNDKLYPSSLLFSQCNINSYIDTLKKGYGSCLFNMPAMRVSVCGNGIQEESEECDCGTPDDCLKQNPCCDPSTCKLVKHAECFEGDCCKNCKLLSSDNLCRPAKGECDIPEFCDALSGKCPVDSYKKNGAICSGGLGYCYKGECPVLKTQCQRIWGDDADAAHTACFEKMNVLGTPNGNCGLDHRDSLQKCAAADALCGSLQCSNGETSPLNEDVLPHHFVIHRMNVEDNVYECKAKTYSRSSHYGILVKDGTRCGYQKFCINQTCKSVKQLATGKCPKEDAYETCSLHGVCTNINTCYCEEGWMGEDCSIFDEDSIKGSNAKSYDGMDSYGKELLSPSIVFAVLGTCVLLGVGLMIFVIYFIFCKSTKEAKHHVKRVHY